MTVFNKYLKPKATPQHQPIPGEAMTRTPAGGYAHEVDSWTLLRRFLILGVENGSYYVSEADLVKQNLPNLDACIAEDAMRVLAMVKTVSERNLAPKVNAVLFALAKVYVFVLRANVEASNTQSNAIAVVRQTVVEVCWTFTQLAEFLSYVKALGKSLNGRATRKTIAAWYAARKTDAQMVKYRNRNGFTHADLIRIGHVKPNEAQAVPFRWTLEKPLEGELAGVIAGFEALQKAENATEAVRLIQEYELPHEALPNALQNDPSVWAALVPHMGYIALMRSLSRMSNIGLTAVGSDAARQIAERLADAEAVRAAKVHPLTLFTALTVYKNGRGVRGSLNWAVNPHIADALHAAFEVSFDNAEPIATNTVVAVDVSGSMGAGVAGLPITAAQAGLGMLYILSRLQSRYNFVALTFDTATHAVKALPRSLEAALAMPVNGGGTNCDLPFRWIENNARKTDGLIVITDNMTWAGQRHVIQGYDAVKQVQPGFRAINVLTALHNFTMMGRNALTDPDLLEIVGFPAELPQVAGAFLERKV